MSNLEHPRITEVGRLLAENDRLREALERFNAEVITLTNRVEELRKAAEAENDRLREALDEALDSWQEAAQYKGDYLMKKHGDMEDIAELRKLLTKETGQ
jgi:uncharacterized protein YlxW (UPF0749 family)